MLLPEQVETERLLLRQWCDADTDAYAEICADPEVMRYLIGEGKSFDRLESWRHLALLVGHWQLKGFGHWAVEEKSSGRLIGRLGFLQPDGWPGFEIGWTLARNCWGKGYATEGAKTILPLAFDRLGKEEVISLIHPHNEPSKKVAARVGESFSHSVRLMGVKLEVWKITAQDHRSGLNW